MLHSPPNGFRTDRAFENKLNDKSHRSYKLSFKEVLGVCVIVLALTSVIVPVFAGIQKSSSTSANLKQLATAIIAYSEDYSGTFPIAIARSATTGQWWWNNRVAVPAGWPPSFDQDRSERDRWVWVNSTKPYYQDSAVLTIQGLPKFRSLADAEYDNARYPWENVSVTFNGLLHTYPMSSVSEPSKQTLIWTGMGLVQHEGFTVSNPTLICNQTNQPCRYQPASSGCGLSLNGSTGQLFSPYATVWLAGRSAIFVSIDTAVRIIPLGAVVGDQPPDGQPFTDWRYDPYTGYNAQGRPGFYWVDGCHPWLFRPDFDFAN
ncbi:MAG: hypothetical protein WAO58_13095 [Fimbriimonadaceae bacterium]